MNSGKSNGDSGETSVTQPKPSTPKLSTKARSSASLGQSKQSKLDQSEQPNAEAVSQSQSLSQSQINKALSTPLPSSVISVKFDKQDKPDSKRRREDTLSSQGSSSS